MVSCLLTTSIFCHYRKLNEKIPRHLRLEVYRMLLHVALTQATKLDQSAWHTILLNVFSAHQDDAVNAELAASVMHIRRTKLNRSNIMLAILREGRCMQAFIQLLAGNATGADAFWKPVETICIAMADSKSLIARLEIHLHSLPDMTYFDRLIRSGKELAVCAVLQSLKPEFFASVAGELLLRACQHRKCQVIYTILKLHPVSIHYVSPSGMCLDSVELIIFFVIAFHFVGATPITISEAAIKRERTKWEVSNTSI